jgi:hypothetical protein
VNINIAQVLVEEPHHKRLEKVIHIEEERSQPDAAILLIESHTLVAKQQINKRECWSISGSTAVHSTPSIG